MTRGVFRARELCALVGALALGDRVRLAPKAIERVIRRADALLGAGPVVAVLALVVRAGIARLLVVARARTCACAQPSHTNQGQGQGRWKAWALHYVFLYRFVAGFKQTANCERCKSCNARSPDATRVGVDGGGGGGGRVAATTVHLLAKLASLLALARFAATTAGS